MGIELPPPIPREEESRGVPNVWLGCLGFAAVAILLALGMLWWSYSVFQKRQSGQQQEVTALLDEIRAAGLPVTIEELEAYYPAVPDEENVAVPMKEACGQLVECDYDEPMILINDEAGLKRGDEIPADMKKASAKYVADNEKCMELAREALKRSRCRYDLDTTYGTYVYLGNTYELGEIASMFVIEAILSADAGDGASACESLINAIRMSHTLSDAPLADSQDARESIINSSVYGMEQIINRADLDDAQLERIAREFAPAEDPDMLFKALVGERCVGIVDIESAAIALFSNMRKLMGVHYDDLKAFITHMNRAVDASRKPEGRRLRLMAGIQKDLDELDPFKCLKTITLVDDLEHMVSTDLYRLAAVRILLAAVAVERYRLRHGETPETLETLVPEFLAAVPADPFDGKPLRYLRRDNGFTVYSIGSDEEDDGGVELDGYAYWSEGDCAFALDW